MSPVPGTPMTPVPGSSIMTPVPGASMSPVPIISLMTPVVKQRSTKQTPRKLVLRKRLRTTMKLSAVMKQRARLRYIRLKDQQRKLRKLKYLKSSLLRKETKIKQLKSELSLARSHGPVRDVKNLYKSHVALKERKRQQKKKLAEEFKVKEKEYEERIKEMSSYVAVLENEIDELGERLAEKGEKIKVVTTEGKIYSSEMRMLVFDCICNNVPMANIPNLILSFCKRTGVQMSDIPSVATCNQMARELGDISKLQSAEVLFKTGNVTLGFDATTQEGVHVNSVHITTPSNTCVVAVDQLPGGTSDDYSTHINTSIAELATCYSSFNKEDHSEVKSKMIKNISNTMSDRAAVNHATIVKLQDIWGQHINELSCNLHPLETIATECKNVLRAEEKNPTTLFGKDCKGANFILQLNKMRYKDSKGDPRAFLAFLGENGLPKGYFPRYRGNRLHVLFHISGKIIEIKDKLKDFLEYGTASCGGLQKAMYNSMCDPETELQLEVLAAIGKFFSGPWMSKFYTSSGSTLNLEQCIGTVKAVVDYLKQLTPDSFDKAVDFFGQKLSLENVSFLEGLKWDDEFVKGFFNCIRGIVKVLERQYTKYFALDLDKKLKEETESARSHNIDSEEIMGMFSALKSKAPSSTMAFISSKILSKKNKTVDYLEAVEQGDREKIIKWAISYSNKRRVLVKQGVAAIDREINRRLAEKKKIKQDKNRKQIEKQLKNIKVEEVDTVLQGYSVDIIERVKSILGGEVILEKIKHIWDEDGSQVVYNGEIKKMKKKKKGVYVVSYWTDDEETAIDYEMPAVELAVDFINNDLHFL